MTNEDSSVNLSEILHPRIIDNCFSLLNANEYISSAREALVQVELAVKEKTGNPNNKFGVKLIDELFNGKNAITVKTLFDNNEDACKYFSGVFSYYRNYCAHDGRMIDKRLCFQILAIASNMLNVINASNKSFIMISGVDGLIKNKVFSSIEKTIEYLLFLESNLLIDGVFDDFFEASARLGYTDDHLQAVTELGLVECVEDMHIEDIFDSQVLLPTERFVLTALGNAIVKRNIQ